MIHAHVFVKLAVTLNDLVHIFGIVLHVNGGPITGKICMREPCTMHCTHFPVSQGGYLSGVIHRGMYKACIFDYTFICVMSHSMRIQIRTSSSVEMILLCRPSHIQTSCPVHDSGIGTLNIH